MSPRRRGAVGVALRTAAISPALSVLAVLIVALTSFAGAAAPGALQATQSESLRYALESVPSAQRDLTAVTRGVPDIGPGTGPEATGLPDGLGATWGAALDELDSGSDTMDPAVREVVGPPHVVVSYDRVSAIRADPSALYPLSDVIVALDPHWAERVRIVQGSAPETSAPETSASPSGPLQIAMAAPIAAAQAWAVGEQRQVRFSTGLTVDLVLTGIFEPLDPDDPEWQHTLNALEPSEIVRGLQPSIFLGMAFTAPGELVRAATQSPIVSTEVWYPFTVDDVTAPRARDLVAGLRLFTATALPFTILTDDFFFEGLGFRTASGATITIAEVRTDAMAAIAALVATGPLAVALVVLALGARLITVRRRRALVLARARGASIPLIAALLAAEGLVIGAVGALIGGIAGAVLTRGEGAIVAAVPVLAALTVTVTLPVLGISVLPRRIRADGAGGALQLVARWRLGAELALVVLTAGTIALVLTRAPADEEVAVDPLLTILPLLLASVGCVVALRILPAVLGVVTSTAARGRGLVGLLGAARARRDPAMRVAPVLAAVVGVSVTVFAVGFLATVDTGIDAAARAGVGADLRVTAPFINEEQLTALTAIDGVAAVAPVYADVERDAELPDGRLQVMVYVIDVAELRAVQQDPESAIPLPDALLAGVSAADGVPVLASQLLADRVGTETLEVEGHPVQIVGTAPSSTPLGGTTTWIAVDRSVADQLVPAAISPAVALLDLDATADGDAVAADARQLLGPSSTAVSPAGASAERRADPALQGLQVTLAATVGIVALYLTVALAMTMVLGAPARGRLLALLGALGFRRSRETGLVIWEVAPAVLLALPIGLLIGLWLPSLVVQQIDLTGFVGGASQPLVRFSGAGAAVVAGGYLVLVALAVAIAALLARRVTAARTLRTIDDEG